MKPEGPLLATKLFVPQLRPNRVERPRLVTRLNQGLGGKLTLVSAPAGFGKTTLVADWLRQLDRSFAWLSLDERDNEPVHFLAYLGVALERIHDDWGRLVEMALLAPQPPAPQAVVATLINEMIAAGQELVLALDDYHTISHPAIHETLSFLLEHLPPTLHLVLVTRADPPLPLARLRARGHLSEIRAGDLRFTAEEAAAFLNQVMGLDLAPQQIATLDARTEGWIAGLQLAALSLRSLEDEDDVESFIAAFAGSHRYVMDYLMEEVFNRQAPHIQQFLLQTSILDRLSGRLCDAVVEPRTVPRDERGTSSVLRPPLDGQSTLVYLEEHNLFTIPLDEQRRWYRYHHLFADLLRDRLRQTWPERIRDLHGRASNWYEAEGLVAEAVSHALAAPDWERATALIERHAPDFASRGQSFLARQWLEKLPEDRTRSSPYLCLLRSLWEQSPPLAARWLDAARDAWQVRATDLDTCEDVDHIAQIRFEGWLASARADLAFSRGDPLREVIQVASEALGWIPADDLLYNMRARSNLFFTLGLAHWHLGDQQAAQRAFSEAQRLGETIQHWAIAIKALYIRARMAYDGGRLRQAQEICDQGLRSHGELARTRHPVPLVGGLEILRGAILLDRNELEAAERALTRGLERIQLAREPHIEREGLLALARIRGAQGDMAAAWDLLEQAAASRQPAVPDVHWQTKIDSEAAARKVQLGLAQAGTDATCLADLVRFLEGRSVDLDARDQYSVEALALARVLITWHRVRRDAGPKASATGPPDLQRILRFLEVQFQTAAAQDQIRWMIESSILRALALQAEGQTKQARSALARALALAEPEGQLRAFLDEGPPMAALLDGARSHGMSGNWIKRLLAAFEQPVATQPLVEPLTPREMDVLGLIAAGQRNQEIADELVISLATVKRHISNLYGKLGVSHRTQAIARAQDVGLLPAHS
jgi:LuxR family maltose regulon positive regulatory protein